MPPKKNARKQRNPKKYDLDDRRRNGAEQQKRETVTTSIPLPLLLAAAGAGASTSNNNAVTTRLSILERGGTCSSGANTTTTTTKKSTCASSGLMGGGQTHDDDEDVEVVFPGSDGASKMPVDVVRAILEFLSFVDLAAAKPFRTCRLWMRSIPLEWEELFLLEEEEQQQSIDSDGRVDNEGPDSQNHCVNLTVHEELAALTNTMHACLRGRHYRSRMMDKTIDVPPLPPPVAAESTVEHRLPTSDAKPVTTPVSHFISGVCPVADDPLPSAEEEAKMETTSILHCQQHKYCTMFHNDGSCGKVEMPSDSSSVPAATMRYDWKGIPGSLFAASRSGLEGCYKSLQQAAAAEAEKSTLASVAGAFAEAVFTPSSPSGPCYEVQDIRREASNRMHRVGEGRSNNNNEERTWWLAIPTVHYVHIDHFSAPVATTTGRRSSPNQQRRQNGSLADVELWKALAPRASQHWRSEMQKEEGEDSCSTTPIVALGLAMVPTIGHNAHDAPYIPLLFNPVNPLSSASSATSSCSRPLLDLERTSLRFFQLRAGYELESTLKVRGTYSGVCEKRDEHGDSGEGAKRKVPADERTTAVIAKELGTAYTLVSFIAVRIV